MLGETQDRPMELSHNDKLRIAKHLLLSAAYLSETSFDSMATELTSLFCLLGNDNLLTEEFLKDVRAECARRYHLAWNKTGSSHVRKCTENIDSIFQQEMEKHVDKFYQGQGNEGKSEKVAGFQLLKDETCGEVTLEFGGEVVSSKNSTSSRWVCLAKVHKKFSKGKNHCTDLSCQFEIVSHYYEDCNFELKSKMEYGPLEIKGVDEYSTVENIMKQIKSWEEECIRSLEGISLEKQLKSLRRLMPITRQKMDWNIQPHRMVNGLRKSSSQV